MADAELLPCPFCGHTDQDRWPCEWLDSSGANVIRCAWCHGAAPAAVWNRRALAYAPPSAPVGVEWLRAELNASAAYAGDYIGDERVVLLAVAMRKIDKLAALAQQPAAPSGEAVNRPRDWRAALTFAREVLDTERDCREPVGPQRAQFTRTINCLDAMLATPQQPAAGSFQQRVQPWMLATFGAEIAGDVTERGDRLLEEVLELLQSHGYDPGRVATLRDYVFNRPVGEPAQEVGGVMVTLAAYCLATGLDMHDAAEVELARVWTKVETIRAKQASKRGLHTPLPVPPQQPAGVDEADKRDAERYRGLRDALLDDESEAWDAFSTQPEPKNADDFDAAVDAALAAQQQGGAE